MCTAATPPASLGLPGWLGEFVLLASLWGASFLFMRLGAVEFGPLPTAGLRVALAALFLLPLLLRQGQWGALRRHWKPALLAGVINSAIPFALFAWAVMHIATGLSSILNAAVPLFGALVAWLWLGERISRLRWIGLAMGLAGVALLAWRAPAATAQGSAQAGWAVLACLCASTCYAVAASFAQRYLRGVPPLACTTGSQIGAALALALPTVWAWPEGSPSLRAWAAIAAIALLCTGIAYLLYFRLIERAGPSRALAVTFLAPVFAVCYGALFLGEAVTVWMLGCGLVIVCGTMLSTGLLEARRGGVGRP
ncbi:EamA-like transporter family protein [Melaminivora alkalimesophila]|uniref:EamA-like transporter family protein n=2 Tax=Melaminivora alkalimesophila TaxID=1165852 RepID=A0A317RAP7_9BURK|nr:DMT family transporter [Melaminivora alkalimesophila]PWW46235.1 EamA-like transporter family protein [Melaminivora alkalimesophila]